LSIDLLEPAIEVGKLVKQIIEEVTRQVRQLCGG
jgi:hypothetical protein